MRTLRMLGMAMVILTLSACSGKGNADKIVGTWEVTKPGKGTPPGATVEFTKDGKMIMTATGVKMEGQYKVEGDKITATMKLGEVEKKESLKIKSLTDTALVTEDEKGDVDEFKGKNECNLIERHEETGTEHDANVAPSDFEKAAA